MNKWSQVIAIEQSATGTRCLIVTRDGRVVGAAFEAHHQLFPQAGWIEQDPAELWYKAKKVIAAGLDIHRTFPAEIAAIGITCPRDTTLVWNRETGEPYYNAIVARDLRSQAICDQWIADGLAAAVEDRTGLPLSPYFATPRLKWLLEHVPHLREEAEQGRALFGSLDSWLLWNLTRAHCTDYTNAARTLLFNLQTCDWDSTLLDRFGIPRAMLPQLQPSSEAHGFGSTRERGPFGGEAPVCGDLADRSALLFGLACFNPGEACLTSGRPASILLPTGTRIIRSHHAARPVVAYALQPGQPRFALEIVIAEPAPAPAMDGVSDDVPGVAGIARAIENLEEDAGIKLSVLKLEEGAVAGEQAQLLADTLKLPVIFPEITETAALGAAFAAGLAVGFWENLEELAANWRAARFVEPGEPRSD